MPRFTTEQIFNSVVYKDVVDRIGGLDYNIGDVAFRLNRSLLDEETAETGPWGIDVNTALIDSFDWSSSSEGHEYWAAIHARMPTPPVQADFFERRVHKWGVIGV